MVHTILKIFDFLKSRKYLSVLSFLLLSVFLVFQVVRLDYKEDISDFLPLEGQELKALKVYQEIAGANRIFVSFALADSTESDPDVIVEAITSFVEDVSARDKEGLVSQLVDQIDMEKFSDVSDFVYQNIPYFLGKDDYAYMDSVLSDSDYVADQLRRDKQMLMFPMGGLLSQNIRRDPLNLFTPVVSRLQNTLNSVNYELYEGHIFTPDMRRGLVIVSSPFGSSETERNTELISLLNTSISEVNKENANLDIRLIGGPVIAVGNANQIKMDSVFSVALAVVLILLLLWTCFRNFRNLLLIALSIGWGWLFAIGGLALVHNEISVIVIGISSVILGIAVNYPLHLIAHLSHTPDMRNALKEIIAPLVVGNITTVGAFLSLVPLESVALRDLGLFSSFLLIGTILFVLIYLPHVAKSSRKSAPSYISKIGNINMENKPWLVIGVLILTCVFGYYSTDTSFDANMSNINYMTERQKEDMKDLAQMISGREGVENLYIVSSDSTIDGALDKSLLLQPVIHDISADYAIKSSGCTQFLVSTTQQKKRLDRWHEFVSRQEAIIKQRLSEEMEKQGFHQQSFDEFFAIVNETYQSQDFRYFEPLYTNMFSSNLSIDSVAADYNIIDILSVKKEKLPEIKARLESAISDSFCFDVMSMNSSLARTLSDDFDYIGFACGTIVFFFLWFSLGSIELAILSFIPMIVSWIWILGIMGILGIHFNIVNVILATFIFGQGDDYTIFMTEGSCYEYAYRKKMLPSYKNSITISALIMFIGIGTLIFAKHPALYSLAQVTIVGMFSVVLMAYLFPPLFYKWLIQAKGQYRMRPIALLPVVKFFYCAIVFYIEVIIAYILGFVLLDVLKPTDKRRMIFRRFVHKAHRFDMTHLPGVKFEVANPHNETFEHPTLIICNHQSLLDSTCFTAISPKIVFITNHNAANHRTVLKIFRWLENIVLDDFANIDRNRLRDLVARGFSICIFPEGKRNDESSITRFHKGAFNLAQELDLDITPVFFHGLNNVLPNKQFMLFPGEIHIEIAKRIDKKDLRPNSCGTVWRGCYHYYKDHYAMLKKQYETAAYFKEFVKDRYRYKGASIYHGVSRRLGSGRYDEWVDAVKNVNSVVIYSDGCGEFALLMALVHADKQILVVEKEEDAADLLFYSADNVVRNLKVFAHYLPVEYRLPLKDNNTLIYEVSDDAVRKIDNYL